VLVRELQSIGLDLSVAKRTKEGEEVEIDLMAEVEEVRPRGGRRMSPFGEIGLESELAELTKLQMVPQTAVAVGEPDADEAEAEQDEIRAEGMQALEPELRTQALPDLDTEIEPIVGSELEVDPIEASIGLVDEADELEVAESIEEEV
jgi:hypothetical protein